MLEILDSKPYRKQTFQTIDNDRHKHAPMLFLCTCHSGLLSLLTKKSRKIKDVILSSDFLIFQEFFQPFRLSASRLSKQLKMIDINTPHAFSVCTLSLRPVVTFVRWGTVGIWETAKAEIVAVTLARMI